MEPMTLVLNAVVAGAAVILKPAVQLAVKDAYDMLKGCLKRKSAGLVPGIEWLEQNPKSEARRAAVREGLSEAAQSEGFDAEVLKAAQALIAAVAKDRESAAAAVQAGVTVEDLEAGASIDLGRVIAQAGPVVVRRLSAAQDIRIGEISSGNPRGRQ